MLNKEGILMFMRLGIFFRKEMKVHEDIKVQEYRY